MPYTYYRRFLSTEERFWSYVQRGNSLGSCWLWVGTLDSDGYGRFSIKSKPILAHRFSYELVKPTIPKGLVIDHLCHTRNCVNPNHIRLVTTSENVYSGNSLWAVNKRKTHCKRGHPLMGKNLYLFHRGNRTERHCRTCRSSWMVQHRAKIRSA